jgi:hypothetical protein
MSGPKEIDLAKLNLDQLKALVDNRRVGPAAAAVDTKGASERRRASLMANWTTRHGKNDAAIPIPRKT